MRQKKQEANSVVDFYNPHQKQDATPLKALTPAQDRYIKAIKSSTLTFGVGPAGTGKSYIVAALAAEALKANTLNQFIVIRPCVEAGEKLGFIPGELASKYEPFLEPVVDILNERLGKSLVSYYIKQERIVGKPLAYLRGKTLKNSMVIVDEAQNLTKAQMLMVLTRIGEGCKLIIDGDMAQSDIKDSGLLDAITRLEGNLNDCRIVRFTNADVVRSGIVADILALYDK